MAATAKWTPERSAAGNINPWLIVGVISLATFMEVLDTSIANVSLDHIAGGLSASRDQATWVLTSYLVANAIVIPISGWLSDVIGRKRYYMISVALFTGASLACAIAPNLPLLILARIIQGVGGGGLAPSEQSFLADTFPPEKRGQAFAAYGVVVVVGPVLGPTLGGIITDQLSWHWIFLINVPIGIASLLLVQSFVTEPKKLLDERKERLRHGLKVDYVGFALIALGLGCLEIVLERGEREAWFESGFVTGMAIVSVLSIALLVWWELARKDPIVDLKLLKNRNFAITMAFMMTTGAVLFGTTTLIPQMLQDVFSYNATNAGLALTVGGIATLVAMPVVGQLAGRVDTRALLIPALMLQALALWYMSGWDTNLSFGDASKGRLISALGLPFLFIPISTAAYVGIPATKTNEVSSLLNVARNLGGSLGIGFSQAALIERGQVHQDRLVEGLNPLNPAYVDGLDRLGRTLGGGDQGMTQIGALYQQVQQQARMLSYIDVFWVSMIFVICIIPFGFFLRQGRTPEGGGGVKRGGLALALLIGGCTVGPTYRPPAASAPARFAEAADVSPPQPVLAGWWRAYRDPELDRLVDMGLSGAPDVAIAVARIAQARATERTARAGFFPDVDANAAFNYQRFSKNAGLSSLSSLFGGGASGGSGTGSAGGGSGGGVAAPGDSIHTYAVGFDASWELDLFGGTRRQVEGARARTEAAIWNARDAQVSLIAEIADAYLQLRTLQDRERIARQEVDRQQRNLDIARATARSGLIAEGDFVRQRADLAGAEGAVGPIVAEGKAAMHAIAVLTGQTPDALIGELAVAQPSLPPPPAVPPGLPSDLLRRRPDVRSAERNLAAATADIGVAVADLYPRFSLTGMAQLISTALSNLFTPDSLQLSGNAAATFPLVDFGRRSGAVDQRRAAAEISYQQYRQTVLVALRDVEDALVRIRTEQQRREALVHGLVDARRGVASVDARWRSGLVDYGDVLLARASSFQAEDQLAQSDGMLRRDLLALYKALGGGWEELPLDVSGKRPDASAYIAPRR